MNEQETISKYFTELANKKHAKTTKKQRSQHARKMALSRWAIYRAKKLLAEHEKI